ncbi:hypothetical protein [Alteriqipengyuania sp.]
MPISGWAGAALFALTMQAHSGTTNGKLNTDSDAAIATCVDPSIGQNPTDAQMTAIIACIFSETAAQMDAGLPSKIDEITTLVAVSSHGTTFKYVYVLDVETADVRQQNIDALEASTRQNACTNANMMQTMEAGGSYFYRWVDRSGVLITSFTIEGC